MKKYSRVCAYIDLDAIAYNMEQMKKRIEYTFQSIILQLQVKYSMEEGAEV